MVLFLSQFAKIAYPPSLVMDLHIRKFFLIKKNSENKTKKRGHSILKNENNNKKGNNMKRLKSKTIKEPPNASHLITKLDLSDSK